MWWRLNNAIDRVILIPEETEGGRLPMTACGRDMPEP